MTRPSKISGNPVTSSMEIIFIPASSNDFFVPPVEIISYPNSIKFCTNGTKFVLSDTLTNARFISLHPPKYLAIV